MLSYRHAFHAGNHADVLKHSILIFCIRHLLKKDKSVLYVDTHAGAGLYDLKGDYAGKKKEYLSGIAPLLKKQNDLPPILQDYASVVSSINPTIDLEFYPGSPLIAQKLLREKDQIRLHEIHNSDFAILNDHTVNDKRVLLQKKDGLRGMIKAFPPPSRRGIVLIDPPYEMKNDYEVLPFAIDDALFKFPQAMILVWYPILRSGEYQFLKANLEQLMPNNFANIELHVRKESPGLYASGMWVMNPPWNLVSEMQEIQGYLAERLGEDSEASLKIKHSIL